MPPLRTTCSVSQQKSQAICLPSKTVQGPKLKLIRFKLLRKDKRDESKMFSIGSHGMHTAPTVEFKPANLKSTIICRTGLQML